MKIGMNVTGQQSLRQDTLLFWWPGTDWLLLILRFSAACVPQQSSMAVWRMPSGWWLSWRQQHHFALADTGSRWFHVLLLDGESHPPSRCCSNQYCKAEMAPEGQVFICIRMGLACLISGLYPGISTELTTWGWAQHDTCQWCLCKQSSVYLLFSQQTSGMDGIPGWLALDFSLAWTPTHLPHFLFWCPLPQLVASADAMVWRPGPLKEAMVAEHV